MQNIQKELELARHGEIEFPVFKIYNSTDLETIWAQLETIVDKFESHLQTIDFKEKHEEQNEPEFPEQDLEEFEEYNEPNNFEEAQEEEIEELDIARMNAEQQNDVEMQLQINDSESEEPSEKAEEQLTEYQQKKNELQKLIKQFESELTSKKSWRQMGETLAQDRPENELLKELPDFQLKIKQKVEITELLNQQIDELVKQRIKDKLFDNPIYKPKEEVKELKDLSTEKTKVGLKDELKTGIRSEVSAEIKKLRLKATEAMQELETELRSYFINGYYMK